MGLLYKFIALLTVGTLVSKRARTFVREAFDVCWFTVFPPKERELSEDSDKNGPVSNNVDAR